MATKKAKQIETPPVTADNIQAEAPVVRKDGDTVMIAVHLPLSHEFDDIPDGQGGVKSVVLPGLNSRDGILLGVGKAKAVTMKRADWEAIVALHGGERMFNSWQGNPPCVMLIKDSSALKGDEVKAMKHGLEPIEAESVGVTEAKRGSDA